MTPDERIDEYDRLRSEISYYEAQIENHLNEIDILRGTINDINAQIQILESLSK